ncbi:MAG: KTSC domain-containing protein [Flammeovirgaceae bacterium]|nr:KTSC domain-containing protein [Flammeovirgaceae bacterium]
MDFILEKDITKRSSILEYMRYSEQEKELEVKFKKGKWKGKKKVFKNISKEVYQTIIDSESVGRALIEVVGEQKYKEKTIKKNQSIIHKILTFL